MRVDYRFVKWCHVPLVLYMAGAMYTVRVERHRRDSRLEVMGGVTRCYRLRLFVLICLLFALTPLR